jgi:hypothetical protein
VKVRTVDEKSDQESKHRPLEIELREGESLIVKTTETIKLAPRVKHIVVGKLEMPKRRESPELVCVEPAQLPWREYSQHADFLEHSQSPRRRLGLRAQ